MNFNWDLVFNSFPLLLVGAGVTIKITVISVALGVLIGLFVGIARISLLCSEFVFYDSSARGSTDGG